MSSAQSVSVVPMIQCRPHGMTNSTDFSVRRISPESERIRSRGTTRWIPLLARTWNWPRSPASAWVSSVHTPVALTTCRARTSNTRPGLQVVHLGADDPLALLEQHDDPGPRRHVRAVGRGRAGDEHRVPRVVHLRVVVLQRADQRVLLERGDDAPGAAAGEVAVVRHAPGPARQQAEGVVQRDARAGVEPLPAAGCSG